MGFNIGCGILAAYPGVKIGVLVCRDVKVDGVNSHLEDLKGRVVMEAAEKIGSEPITKIPFISSWREMYRSFGTKPGDYRPSAEALLRRTLKRRALPRINTAVDAYNTMSIKHLIPMDGFDIDRIQGGISLRFSPGGEGFLPLGASEMEETYEGEPVYADEARVLLDWQISFESLFEDLASPARVEARTKLTRACELIAWEEWDQLREHLRQA